MARNVCSGLRNNGSVSFQDTCFIHNNLLCDVIEYSNLQFGCSVTIDNNGRNEKEKKSEKSPMAQRVDKQYFKAILRSESSVPKTQKRCTAVQGKTASEKAFLYQQVQERCFQPKEMACKSKSRTHVKSCYLISAVRQMSNYAHWCYLVRSRERVLQ